MKAAFKKFFGSFKLLPSDKEVLARVETPKRPMPPSSRYPVSNHLNIFDGKQKP